MSPGWWNCNDLDREVAKPADPIVPNKRMAGHHPPIPPGFPSKGPLAKALNAKVIVITVTEPLEIDYGGGHAGGYIPPQEEFDRFDAACREYAGKVLDEVRGMAELLGISVELLHVPDAHPAPAIIETAKCRGCDLIVMASHGRRGLKKLFLGSQTSNVLADGSLPVLIVP
jgi:nucleotide-binding universal stress UspA family protein